MQFFVDHQLLLQLGGLLGVLCSAFWWIGRLLISQLSTNLDQRFELINTRLEFFEKMLQEKAIVLQQFQTDGSEEIKKLQDHFLDCRQRCMSSFVTRDEFVETLGRFNTRLEALYTHVLRSS